ncbi:hypothetical protein [Burkholderia savannae]|uniref:hypothetical protein n=1 Tax=Burkholderia savannae TaxID=1637837 RepID=UPI0012E3516D|nr:hypothetical protein [Burkholderia savannae]
MQIHDDHMYHGAALIQIAEHPQFTAINSLKIGGAVVPVAYKINDEISLYLKYASNPTPAYKEYPFTFTHEHLSQLAKIKAENSKTFVALVCVKDREICCISYDQLQSLIARRKAEKGDDEDQYVILVTAPERKGLRAYINAPGRKKTMLGKPLIVARNAFPGVVFG